MDLPANIGARVGLLGGTFDPVHNGHLAIATRAREQCRLDAVVFIPAASPPHKEQREIAELRHRRRMLELACGIGTGYYVSSLEAERRGPSYTVDTLRTLKDYFPPQTELFFIIGSDSFIDLPSWKEPARLLDYANLVVASRASRNAVGIERILDLSFPAYRALDAGNIYRREKGGCAIILLDMEPVEVSATEIRERVRQGQAIAHLVPEAVSSYIREQGLYK
jgi:nicotinate-nucleotide adenylyltransferase